MSQLWLLLACSRPYLGERCCFIFTSFLTAWKHKGNVYVQQRAGDQISVTEASGQGLIAVSRQIKTSQEKSSTYCVKTPEQQVNSNFTVNMYKCVSNQNQKCEGNKVHSHIPGQLRAAYSTWVTTFANHGLWFAAHSISNIACGCACDTSSD